MKHHVVVLVMAVGLPVLGLAQAYTSIESYLAADGLPLIQVNSLQTAEIGQPLGLFSFMQVRADYAQAYGGATLPVDWCQLALGVGAQQFNGLWSWRLGGYLVVGDQPDTIANNSVRAAVVAAETGVDGLWLRGQVNFPVWPQLGLGCFGETVLGVGPRLEYCPPWLPLQLGVSPLYDFKTEAWHCIIGATFNW